MTSPGLNERIRSTLAGPLPVRRQQDNIGVRLVRLPDAGVNFERQNARDEGVDVVARPRDQGPIGMAVVL